LLSEVYIPNNITVHLGTPDNTSADNVTVSFVDYVKNVASSEIYPTWNENAIRANVYVIVTYALNRLYTEWYRSKGYDFDITASTQFDQAFVYGRDIFENVSQIVDELFNMYVSKQGNVDPYFTSFCNGTTVTCSGLSQWGSQELAEKGYIPYDILTYYYGKDLNILSAEVRNLEPSFGGIDLKLGSAGNDVKTIQVQLNRVSKNYPLIPKIPDTDGIFGVDTEDAVSQFQSIFNLNPTGIVDKATWYKLSYIYVSVKKLSELNSEGVKYEEVSKQFPEELSIGNEGSNVSALQYYLAVVGAYYQRVTPVEITGYFGTATEESVKSFQQVFGLPETGKVDRTTWNEIYRAYDGILNSIPIDSTITTVLYPNIILKEGISNEYVKVLQEYLTYINRTYPNIPAVNNTGYFGALTKASVIAFQNEFGLQPNGIVGSTTWDAISREYSNLRYGEEKLPYQYPGYTIK
jgi:peptidoglycan hydrolase-like protein with peptidoglycan-binding domain